MSATTRTPLFSRQQPGGLFTIESVPEHPGSIFFIDSGHAAAADATGGGRSPDKPLATLDYAIGLCAANNGDVIYVAPGHAETITAAAGIDLDVAGITVIGLGRGAARPTFTFTTANAADADVDAANITLRNLLFVNGKDGQTAILDVNSTDLAVEDCEFRADATTQPVTFIDINGGAANACDRATVRRCAFISLTAGASSAIELGEVADRVVIEDCVADGDWSDAAIHNPVGKVLTNLLLRRNVVRNRQAGDHAIELVSACTGWAVDNRLFGDTAGSILDPGSLFCAGNLGGAAIDEPGFDLPLAVVDVATNLIGVDDADNAAATTNVAANEDGSVLERLEQIQEATNKGTGTALAANESLVDVLYGANGIAAFPAAAAAANGVSLAEVLRYLSEKQQWRKLIGNWDFATDGGAQGAFTVFTVTGVVELAVFAVCNTNALTSGGAATIELGVSGNTAVLIAQATASAIIANEVWLDATPTTTVEPWDHYAKTFIVTNGQDIIQTIGAADLTAGTLDYYLAWRPLSADGAVVAA